MVDERFPLRKYLRQLDGMEYDFIAWASKYRRIASVHENEALASRYTLRAQLLDELREDLHAVFHTLEGLPRLS